MRGLILAFGAMLAVAMPALAAKEVDAQAEQAAAVKAEKAGDWDNALLHYENIYDSTPTTPQQRIELRHKFEELHPKVKPNEDPAKAGLYKIRVYVFRNTAIGNVKNSISDKNIKNIEAGSAAWAKEVWLASMGNMRVEATQVVIDKPLTKFAGYPDHVNCLPFFTDLKPGEVDFVATFANTNGLPCNCLADTWGPVCKGALCGGFNDDGGGGIVLDAELQVHEWLHAVQMTVDWHQNYPEGLTVNPDAGMDCGKNCWQPKEGKKGLYDWYRHLMAAHITRKMWHDMSVLRPTDNVWIDRLNVCRDLTVIGPFEAAGKPNGGLDTAFIDESNFKPAAGEKVGSLAWRQVYSSGRELNLGGMFYPQDKQAAYVAAVVNSPKAVKAQARVGFGSVGKLWHNGKLILTASKPTRSDPEQNKVDIDLAAGENVFVLKVINNQTEDWACILRITDKDGKAVPGVTFAAPGEKAK